MTHEQNPLSNQRNEEYGNVPRSHLPLPETRGAQPHSLNHQAVIQNEDRQTPRHRTGVLVPLVEHTVVLRDHPDDPDVLRWVSDSSTRPPIPKVFCRPAVSSLNSTHSTHSAESPPSPPELHEALSANKALRTGTRLRSAKCC